MYIVTFYSYKGGVGRTMALMNVAFRLSARRKKVFIIDFDLEAPGIDVFCKHNDCDEARSGLVEYVSSYSRTGAVDELTNYVYSIEAQEPEAFPLHILPAGKKDDEYQIQLAQLNWKEFYSEKRGFFFVENLKAAIEATYAPDYLLIDSRTGLTDISGICTLQLPDLVVMLFGLNQQNVSGTTRIYKSIVNNRLDRQIDTLLVASPVPELSAYSEKKDARVKAARLEIGADIDTSIPFDASIAFEESVVLKEQSSSLARAYDVLTDKIIAHNTPDFLNMEKVAKALQRGGESEDAEAKFHEILTAFPASADAHESYARFLRSRNRLLESVDIFKRALALGGRQRILGDVAAVYLALGKKQEALGTFSAYLEHAHSSGELARISKIFAFRGETRCALLGFERAFALLPPDDPQSGDIIFQLGNLHLAERDPQKAVGYIEKALVLEPNSMAACFNYAFALELLGRCVEACEYYLKTSKLFEKADVSRYEPTARANILQAMGHCYHRLGNDERAIQCLKRAGKIADSIPKGRIFSSLQYRDVSSQEFKEETERLIQELSSLPPGIQ